MHHTDIRTHTHVLPLRGQNALYFGTRERIHLDDIQQCIYIVLVRSFDSGFIVLVRSFDSGFIVWFVPLTVDLLYGSFL